MGKKYKIGIWGQYGDGGKIADGQAVRTTIITNELYRRYGKENIVTVNTNAWKKHPISFFLKTVKLYFSSQKVVVLPADNGFKVVVGIYDFLQKLKKKELYDVVIGGYLPKLLAENPKYIKKLAKYKGLFVQTVNIKKDLEKFGLTNIYTLSNPKRLNTRKPESLVLNVDKYLSVCMLSRVSKDKGIEDAIDAVRLFNEHCGEIRIKLDIYGMILPSYKERFEQLLSENPDFVTYKGIADYDKTVETLTPYFALLFPTYFHGEGFPGNMIDCFNTGLPVIATDWLYNKDVIQDGKNGLLIPIKNPEALCEAIETLYNDRAMALQIAKNNLFEAQRYAPDGVMKEFYAFMDR